jgi:hypothetical protein
VPRRARLGPSAHLAEPAGLGLVDEPAEQLEQAILAQLKRVLAYEEVVRGAIAEAFSELDAERPRREAELRQIESEVRRVDEALGRYFRAFEQGTMSERACGERVVSSPGGPMSSEPATGSSRSRISIHRNHLLTRSSTLSACAFAR